MCSSRISELCACVAAGSLKSAHAQQQDLWSLRRLRSTISEVCACATAGSLNCAHAQQQDLWSLRMRSSRISKLCACAAAGSLKSAHSQQQDLLICACAAAGSLKSAHAQQQDLLICACAAAGSLNSAHVQQCLRSRRMRDSASEVCTRNSVSRAKQPKSLLLQSAPANTNCLRMRIEIIQVYEYILVTNICILRPLLF